MNPAPVSSRSCLTGCALVAAVWCCCSCSCSAGGGAGGGAWCRCGGARGATAWSGCRGVPVGFLLGRLAGELCRDVLGAGAILRSRRGSGAARQEVVVIVRGEAESAAAREGRDEL